MLTCIPFAWMWMSPRELKGFAQSVVAVSLFGSNILFCVGACLKLPSGARQQVTAFCFEMAITSVYAGRRLLGSVS